MKPKIFTGAATALVTPMNENGSVNYENLRALVKSQITSGIDALVACGTTGEKSTLKYDEHLKVIETVVNAADKKVPVIAGTGSNDTLYTVELCNDAAKLGADAFLMVTPYYNKASQEGLMAHYSYIADRVNKPIILYNVPSRTGVDIKPQTYKELSKHKNIVAVKEASGDLSKVAETVYLCGDDLWVYSGNDDQIVPIMSLGGLGVISVVSNILPAAIHNLCQNYWVGNTKIATAAQIKYMGLIKALFCDVNPVPVKTAMNLLGLNVGPCRLPLYPMNENNFYLLKEKLTECNLL
ncbi:MAG: 4-hydroxy-tetrahydrodipicolinate synthase [Ruminococcaceae bacterium]|nr:4-hydroxy-tetrahydrodipicolinate synthase [Oscillospiraceae bacterium]